ncbi:TNF receptor-associated factor 2-like [Hydra vulgaris]|uniref:TNF receptor-associated factor 2-like n=1 Tax=Hydra vulgaris TaxID=6087 RepID=A0ABM4BA98_HYDVU
MADKPSFTIYTDNPSILFNGFYNEKIMNLDFRLTILEEMHNNNIHGCKIWIFENFKEKLKNEGKVYYSVPFYYKNYQFLMKLNINMKCDSHKEEEIGLYIIMRSSPYDALLKWPFLNHVITFKLSGPNGKQMKKSFITENNVSFQRPARDGENVGYGYCNFIKKADNNDYLIENKLYIKY